MSMDGGPDHDGPSKRLLQLSKLPCYAEVVRDMLEGLDGTAEQFAHRGSPVLARIPVGCTC